MDDLIPKVGGPQPESDAATPAAEGFFHCGHCNHIVSLQEDADPAQTFKCPRCRKWTVKWRLPMSLRTATRSKVQSPKSVPVAPDSEFAKAAFANLHALLGGDS